MTDNTAWGDELATELGKYAGAVLMKRHLANERHKDHLPSYLAEMWKLKAEEAFREAKAGQTKYHFHFFPWHKGDNYSPPLDDVLQALPADLLKMYEKGALSITTCPVSSGLPHFLFTLNWEVEAVNCYERHKRMRQEVEDATPVDYAPPRRWPPHRGYGYPPPPRRQLATKAARIPGYTEDEE